MHSEFLTFFRVTLEFLYCFLIIALAFSDMASFYETLAAESVLEMDQSILDTMRAKIDEEIKKLDEK